MPTVLPDSERVNGYRPFSQSPGLNKLIIAATNRRHQRQSHGGVGHFVVRDVQDLPPGVAAASGMPS